ncbi:MAG: GAF domain-containing protein [bacterium]|nr:GAF domain-containing protein [bacterium]
MVKLWGQRLYNMIEVKSKKYIDSENLDLTRLEKKEKYKILIVVLLLFSCCLLTYYFHMVLNSNSIFSHFFYVPIILSSIWWERSGVLVAIFLALLLILTNLFFQDTSPPSDYIRASMLIIIGAVISGLAKRMKRTQNRLLRVNRALKAYSGANLSIVRAIDEMELYNDICKLMVYVAGYRFAWVGFAEQDELKSIRPLAQAGFDDGYLKSLNLTWEDTEMGQGPSGKAIRTGKPAVSRNILTDPDFKPWRSNAIKSGYQSAVSIPFKTANEVMGMLTVYSDIPEAFNEDEVDLLVDLTNDFAFGIDSLRTRIERDQVTLEIRELNKELEERVKQRTRKLNKTNEKLLLEIEERELLFKELEEKTRELESFVHTASHDLKAPLVVMGGYSSVLLKKYKQVLDETGKNYLELIRDNVFRMESLIQDLLELSRIGKVVEQKEQVDVEEILATVKGGFLLQLDKNGIVLDICTPLPKAYANKGRILQIFDNLIGNAMKFKGDQEKPIIQIGAHKHDEKFYRFYVKDNGIGIDKKDHELVFQEFNRLNEVETEGTGIGLAIVKKIIEHHGGSIWVESETGKGASFYFLLPVKEK